MTSEEFVKAVKVQTSDAAIEGTIRSLKRPPGRKPSEKLLTLSSWFNQLEKKDQDMLREALREAAEMAVFEFFCVLDGVSAIEDTSQKGNLELHFNKNAERRQLNDPQQEELHNLFNALCRLDFHAGSSTAKIDPYEQAPASDLKSKLTSSADLDVHHVPGKYLSLRTVRNYDPETAPAIAIPKLEHRQIPPDRCE